ncbi:MAG: ADP-forming succinate--CoA ligase subunit beta [Hyphomicrobiaceae bacterium]|nr:ADP-forming succinate--CoA ligase subunit beta [Hyphomicrobiaceae bacterium]
MNLYEFQAKELISRFGIEIPRGRVAASAEDAERLARRLAFKRFAIKAQIHGGGRGAAGGIKFANTPEEARRLTADLMSRPLVTSQTRASGEKVRWVYVEEAFTIEREIYAAVVVDRARGQLALLVAAEGGEDIEEREALEPGLIKRFPLDVTSSPPSGDFAAAAAAAGLTGGSAARVAELFSAMARVSSELDAMLVEVNPLALTDDGRAVALDAKLTVDDNALFRHPALSALRSQIQIEEGDPKELAADRHQINYQKMDGNIGVVVNGAGLALATLDMLIDAGGRPANFMDIRTTATSLDIAYGIEVIVDNPLTHAVLINVHGGGMQRCDDVAEGVAIAMRRARRSVPFVVRFAGNNADFARVRLKSAGVAFEDAGDMADAVAKAVSIASRRTAS